MMTRADTRTRVRYDERTSDDDDSSDDDSGGSGGPGPGGPGPGGVQEGKKSGIQEGKKGEQIGIHVQTSGARGTGTDRGETDDDDDDAGGEEVRGFFG